MTVTLNGHVLKTVCNLIRNKLIIYLSTRCYLPQILTKYTLQSSVYDDVYFDGNLRVYLSDLAVLY
jgi:hypothetical protein